MHRLMRNVPASATRIGWNELVQPGQTGIYTSMKSRSNRSDLRLERCTPTGAEQTTLLQIHAFCIKQCYVIYKSEGKVRKTRNGTIQIIINNDLRLSLWPLITNGSSIYNS